MKTFECTIDFESYSLEVEAENEEEAVKKATEEYQKLLEKGIDFPSWWVGDTSEND